MATKKITEFDTHSIAAADYLLFSNAAGTATYKTTLLSLLSNLTLTKETVGFTIAGGTTPKTLTLDTDITASLLTTTSTAILVSNLDTDGTLAANSDTKVPSQKAIKTYVDTNYVAMTGNQTVAGIKTFSSFPVSPSSAPTADYEMANKKYVDDTAFAGVPDATESTPGKAELATQAETDDGTDDERIVTPKKLATTLGGKVSTTGNETVNGVKTFGSIPVLPASDPTTDNQAVRKLYAEKMGGCYVAGDTLLISSDTERQTDSGSYVKLKEIHIPKGGTLRIKFSVAAAVNVGSAYAKIYRNGVAVGTEREVTFGEGYEEFSEDISGWNPGDFVQIYAKKSNAAISKVKNFRIYGTLFYAPEVTMD